MSSDSNPDQEQNASAASLAALIRFVIGKQLANRELRTRDMAARGSW